MQDINKFRASGRGEGGKDSGHCPFTEITTKIKKIYHQHILYKTNEKENGSALSGGCLTSVQDNAEKQLFRIGIIFFTLDDW